MFATGAVLLPFFSFMSFLIAVPTGVKFFNWIGTMWKGSISFEPPMLWAAGFLITFLFGDLTGVILASPPMDFHVTDSYFVVAHFHYVLFGTIVFAMFGGFSLRIEVDDPWGYGRSLEWATSCPPPRHNFAALPRIRSESPAFDLHHPETAERDQKQHSGRRDAIDAEGHEGERS